jgi:hypothetical protein
LFYAVAVATVAVAVVVVVVVATVAVVVVAAVVVFAASCVLNESIENTRYLAFNRSLSLSF